MKNIHIDLEKKEIKIDNNQVQSLHDKEAFEVFKKIWLRAGWDAKYVYSFTWLGRPIIQLPDDMMRMPELIFQVKPTVIIETGIAHGGSLIYYASLLKMMGKGRVIGIDVDIREHNREAIETHPLSHRIELIQGSSIDKKVVEQAKSHIKSGDRVMVILDSNHTHDHVLEELRLYSSFVTKDCYLAVMDTVVEDMPEDYFSDRPWGKGDNPKTAVHEFLKTNNRFE
jgi:cephalosporin hydroxylase